MRWCQLITAMLLGGTVTCIVSNEEMHVPEVAALVSIVRPPPAPENPYEVASS